MGLCCMGLCARWDLVREIGRKDPTFAACFCRERERKVPTLLSVCSSSSPGESNQLINFVGVGTGRFGAGRTATKAATMYLTTATTAASSPFPEMYIYSGPTLELGTHKTHPLRERGGLHSSPLPSRVLLLPTLFGITAAAATTLFTGPGMIIGREVAAQRGETKRQRRPIQQVEKALYRKFPG